MNTTLPAEQPTTVWSYPGFQSLPKGIKQMLLVSEAHFFDQPLPHHPAPKMITAPMRTGAALKEFWRSPLLPSDITLELSA